MRDKRQAKYRGENETFDHGFSRRPISEGKPRVELESQLMIKNKIENTQKTKYREYFEPGRWLLSLELNI